MNKDKEVEAYRQGNLTTEEQTKYEIARELGILDKVLEKRLEKPLRQRNRPNRRHDGQKETQTTIPKSLISPPAIFRFKTKNPPTIRPVNLPSEDSNGKINTNNF